jgi:formylglycine-generating enzyme required for sulfatase activity
VEWEKAARGPEGLIFPWGNTFDPELCSYIESDPVGTRPVGTYSPGGDSIYGIADMAGNVWDWTITLWGQDKDNAEFVYPYNPSDGRQDVGADETNYRIIRGGSFKNEFWASRSACRDLDPPKFSLNNLGFRLFLGPELRSR